MVGGVSAVRLFSLSPSGSLMGNGGSRPGREQATVPIPAPAYPQRSSQPPPLPLRTPLIPLPLTPQS